jgi:hypothetical protein
MDAMETMQRRAPNAGDISDDENEEVEVEEVVVEDVAEDYEDVDEEKKVK